MKQGKGSGIPFFYPGLGPSQFLKSRLEGPFYCPVPLCQSEVLPYPDPMLRAPMPAWMSVSTQHSVSQIPYLSILLSTNTLFL